MAEPKTGGTVYSKRNALPLYAEPTSQAAVVGTIGFAEPLRISGVNPSGKWLNVSARQGSGWVFAGLTVEKQPEAEKTAGIGSVDASSTTTAAAGRPLAPAAEEYAQRHNLVDAGKDVDWVEAEAHKVKPAIVNAYMRTHQQGEYQE